MSSLTPLLLFGALSLAAWLSSPRPAAGTPPPPPETVQTLAEIGAPPALALREGGAR